MKKIFSTIIVVLFVCASAIAQGGHQHQHRHGQDHQAHNHAQGEQCEATIHGHITDSRTKEHIPYITVTIDGVDKLSGCFHEIIPDRIEAGTYMIAAAMTGGDVIVDNVLPEHQKPLIAKLREAGAIVEEDIDKVRVIGTGNLKGVSVKTLPYPGFPTDMQAQMMAMMVIAEGNSKVTETVFENRFMHVDELNRMGAKITTADRSANIEGPAKLVGCDVRATDLRAGAAMILAGLVAEGETRIGDLFHIDRGYENFEEKFAALGGYIKRVLYTE